MAFILAAAFSGGLLSQRLRQPAMVGYILIGIIFGPHGLGLIHEGEEIKHLSELGILLLLFIVGLELDLHKFLPVWKVSIGTALLQITFGLLSMFGLSLIFDWPMEMVVVLGFVVSLSSTAVAIKLLTDMNAMNSSVGNVAVGILIAQDLAVIPMILIVSAIGGASIGEQHFAIGLIMPVILLLVTAFLVWTLVKRPPWLKRFSKITDRAQYALEHDRQRPLTAIMFCFAAGAISGGLGFSAAYGAFIAGLILGNSKYGHSYERQVRPLFDILMMFFFLSMGMLIDFHYLMDNIWTVVVVLFVVMFLKTVINIGILRMFSLSKRNSTFIGATLGQVGEFSFALAALGLSRGAIDGDVYKMVAIVVALSLIATPAWLYTMRRISAMKRYTIRKRRRVAAKPV
jgi:CPA2 family monovalent cation:H+ antiporter-2